MMTHDAGDLFFKFKSILAVCVYAKILNPFFLSSLPICFYKSYS